MKSLQEIQEEVAIHYRLDTWRTLVSHLSIHNKQADLRAAINRVCRLYAQQAVDECVKIVERHDVQNEFGIDTEWFDDLKNKL